MNVKLRVMGGIGEPTTVENIDVIYNNVNIRWLRFDLDKTTITMTRPFKIKVNDRDTINFEKQLTIDDAD